jgi:hypothetical protein
MPIEIMSASPDKPKKYSRICVTKEQAKEFKIGKNVSLKLTGEVKSVGRSYGGEDDYEVEIEEPEVDDIEADEDDDSYATMPREELKKAITKKEY